jgi:hypothetical protein
MIYETIVSKAYWLRLSKVDKGDTQTHKQHDDLVSLLLFFHNKESRLKIDCNLITSNTYN